MKTHFEKQKNLKALKANRYHKIQEVMGVSLDNMEERLEVEFAIKSKIVNDI